MALSTCRTSAPFLRDKDRFCESKCHRTKINTTISQQLTLWDQKGSRVIRGKLIVTPIEDSFLYVVPVYLTAEGTNFPQLKRVIAVARLRATRL
jgi:uncharacterized membrane protein (UPF0182 family)